jgi:hypothetical protein
MAQKSLIIFDLSVFWLRLANQIKCLEMHCSPQDTGINFNTKVPSYSQLFHLIFSRLSSAKSSVYTDPLRGFVDFLPPKQRAKRWVGADLCFVNSNYANAEALQGHRQIFDSSWYIALAGLGFQFSPHERAVIRILLDKEARILQTYASFLLQRGLIWNLRVESDPNVQVLTLSSLQQRY